MHKDNLLIFVFSLLILTACGSGQQPSQGEQHTGIPSLMNNLFSYCDQQLEGIIIKDSYTPEMEGSPLTFHFEKCTENEVRVKTDIPYSTGFTLIFTQVGSEVLLKHDIRDGNLSPGEITMYGGFAVEDNSEYGILFPAHNFGQGMWPGMENYSWRIIIDEDKQKFEYLEYDDQEIKRHYAVNR